MEQTRLGVEHVYCKGKERGGINIKSVSYTCMRGRASCWATEAVVISGTLVAACNLLSERAVKDLGVCVHVCIDNHLKLSV